jgi:5-methylcytosine-specific restriction enzyme subunit McrC
MTHLSVLEWRHAKVGEGGFTRAQADQLLALARDNPMGGAEGTNILVDHHRWLTSQQVVGVIAGRDCSLEILPKIDRPGGIEDGEARRSKTQLRHRLVQMLDVAFNLDIATGRETAIARQDETLLDVVIRAFANRLADEVRRGLPLRYADVEEDLPKLRGRLDVVRQFTTLAVRPDRLACRFDELSADTPILQVMKACVLHVGRFTRRVDTQRRLADLRLALADVTDVAASRLPSKTIHIDRTNRRWKSLLDLARLLIGRRWQATHKAESAGVPEGVTLLFPMNDLFEAYVASLLKRALAPMGFTCVEQGGLRYCLDELDEQDEPRRSLFQTKPDLLVRRDGQTVLIVDTKWKSVSANTSDAKLGVSQSDIYQLMAYARVYECPRLMLLYPFHDDLPRPGVLAQHRVRYGSGERLSVATLDVSASRSSTIAALKELALQQMGVGSPAQASVTA